MAIQDMIPSLSDQELANLQANARRLGDTGSPRQKADAAALIPLIEAELAERVARKPVKAKKAPAKRKTAAALAAEAAEAEGESELEGVDATTH